MRKTTSVAIVLGTLALVAGVAWTQSTPTSGDAGLDSYLGITLYPGSVLVSQNTETEFESSASLQDVYTFIHERLLELDWERQSLAENDVEIEARYMREGLDLRIELEQEGDNRYDLETELSG